MFAQSILVMVRHVVSKVHDVSQSGHSIVFETILLIVGVFPLEAIPWISP